MNLDSFRAWYNTGLVTNPLDGIGRLAVDPQQTSFEQNTQFKFVYEIDSVATGNQLVFKLTIGANPINLFLRYLSTWAGGRKYYVLPESAVTFNGTLGAALPIYPINQNLRDGLSEHPATDVTMQVAIGSNIATYDPADKTAMTACLSGGNAIVSSSEFDSNSLRLGYSANQVVWVVMENISQAAATKGVYKLFWEERI